MSPVFRRQEFVDLRGFVRVVYPWDNDSVAQRCVMKLTGVPPHVVQLAALEQLKVSIGELQPAIEKMMDDRTMGGTLSETRMKSILNDSRMQLIEDLEQRMPQAFQNHSATVYQSIGHGNVVSKHKLWAHHGKFRRVPPSWKFPKCGLLVADRLWHIKNTVTGECGMKL